MTGVVSWAAVLLATASIVVGCGGDDEGPARSGDEATAVEGTVTNPGGQPVAGALVQAAAPDDPTATLPDIALVTDQAGHYRWELGPGSYELTVSKDGFRTAANRVTLERGDVVTLDFTLEPA
jgi:hypothetical protein